MVCEDLLGVCIKILIYISESTMKSHTHNGSVGNYGMPLGIMPDMNLLSKVMNKAMDQMNNVDSPMFDHRFNIDNFKSEFLDSNGDKYICSEHNKVN